jgi:hypothetical protein
MVECALVDGKIESFVGNFISKHLQTHMNERIPWLHNHNLFQHIISHKNTWHTRTS